jgi:two-component system chemotaxis response regulator CheB
MACGMSAPVPARAGKQEVTGRTNEIRRSGNKVSAKTKRLVFIASSTGGPKALQLVIPYFPEDFPYPIVVVQHMPAGFTESLANRLNDMSPLTVKEAQDGDVLKKGFVYIAQGGKQCELVERPTGEFCLSEKDKPARGGLKPCADIFLESLVSSSMDHFVCGVLTGMGSDACEGIRKVKSQKDIKVVAQNKETCVVYGMPRAVAEAGVVDEVVPLKQVADTMIKQLGV